MAWPTIQDPSTITEETHRPQHKTKFETGRVLSRPKYQRSNDIWVLTWQGMNSTDRALLKAAFEADQGTTFTWSHPIDGAKTVRYADDSISMELNKAGYHRVTVRLEED